MFKVLWVKLISQSAVQTGQWVPCGLYKITELDHTYQHSVFTYMQQHHWVFLMFYFSSGTKSLLAFINMWENGKQVSIKI